MRLHADAIKAAGDKIRLDRYQSNISNDELARKVVTTYKETVSYRPVKPRAEPEGER